MLQLRHAGKIQQAVVSEFARSAQTQRDYLIALGDPRQRPIRHHAIGVHARNASLLENDDQFIPFPIAHSPARTDSVAFRGDHVWRALWRRARGGSLHQGGPAAETGILSDNSLGFLQLQVSLGLAGGALPESVDAAPDFRSHILARKRAAVMLIQPFESRLI